MKSAKKLVTVICVFATLIIASTSCTKFSVMNANPNSITPSEASPDYLMAGVLTQTAKWYGGLGSGMMSGAMQETYQDAFGSSFSDYEWTPTDWSGNYATLNNNKLLLQKAQSYKWNFHQGVALVMRAFNYGSLADYWGDAPDSMALLGDQASLQDEFPAFETQQQMYTDVITDLKAAIPFFAGTMSTHAEITDATRASDVLYAGDPVEWKRFAYSLMLRYYMRLSSKMDVSASVAAIADSVFQSNSDNCLMMLQGADQASSYQFCTKFNGASGFDRNKLCGTLTMKLKDLKDPRIVIMGEPIITPSVVDASKFAAGDNTTLLTIVNNVRYINPAAATAQMYKQFDPATYTTDRPYGAIQSSLWNLYDTSSVYVGVPTSYTYYTDFQYNLNGSGTQTYSLSNYVSYLRRDIYDNPSGPLLWETMGTYSEICFDLAEAALNGWSVGGTAASWYNAGVKASFDEWQVFSSYQSDVNGYYGCVKDFNTYLAQPTVAFNNTLQRIIEQKWIASWQACNEAYMDWRRTGYPAISAGWGAYRAEIPLRFAYSSAELQDNPASAQVAIDKLATTPYIATDGNNSSWSKFWLLQGTGKPW